MNATNKTYHRSQLVLTSAYGFNKYQLGDKMRNCFHIPDNYLPALDIYKVFHLTGTEFAKYLLDGTFEQMGKTFNVIYNNCTPFNAKRAVEVRLSFRAAKKEFGLEPIVLVQIVQAVH